MAETDSSIFGAVITKCNKHKRLLLLNSESEDEGEQSNSITLNDTHNILPDEEKNVYNNDKNSVKGKRKQMTIIDTDSEEENNFEMGNSYNEILQENMKTQLSTIMDSESDEDDLLKVISLKGDQEQNLNVNNNFSSHSNKLEMSDAESAEDIDRNEINANNDIVLRELNQNIPNHIENNFKSRMNALCDSESSEEEKEVSDSEREIEAPKLIKKKYTKSAEPKSNKPMTGKEAMEQRLEIQSDSQKRVRESNVSLPYHKPKPFGIKEFLARRPRLSSAVPTSMANKTPSAAMKMTSDQLEYVTKQLEEREKQIEEFYKSESESDKENEEENDPVATDSGNNVTESNEGKSPQHSTIVVTGSGIQTADDQFKISSANVVEDNANNPGLASVEHEVDAVQNEMVKKNDPILTAINDSESISKIAEDCELVTTENQSATEENSCNTPSQNNIEKSSTTVNHESNLTDEKVIEHIVLADEKHETENNKLKLSNEQESEEMDFEYDFNLDDVEESEDQNKKEETRINQIIEKFCRIDSETEKEANKIESMSLKNIDPKIALHISNIKPRLSTGGKNHMIVLNDDNAEEKSEIAKLMERFVEHSTAKKTNPKHKIEFNVVSVDGNELHNEKLSMAVHPDDEVKEIIEHKPGAGLKKLKEELQLQIARKRTELWKQRVQDSKDRDVTADEIDLYAGEKSECGATDLLDNEDEDEESESSSSSEAENEEDLIENDVPMKDEPKTKSAFVEEEASESEMEDETDEPINDADNFQEENDDDDEDDNEDEDVKSVSSEDTTANSGGRKKPLKRIVAAFEDDSDDEVDKIDSLVAESNDKLVKEFAPPTTPVREVACRKSEHMMEDVANSQLNNTSVNGNHNTSKENLDGKKNTSLDSTDPWEDDDYLTPHQPRTDRTPCRPMTQSKSDYLGLLTPSLRLTALQDFSMPKESPGADLPFPLPPEPSPLRDQNWSSTLQKKLFSDTEITNSQSNTSELADMCSGHFSSSNFGESGTQQTDDYASNETCTQDILDICSGKFSGMTQAFASSPRQREVAKKNDSTRFEEDPILAELLKEDDVGKFKKRLDGDFDSASTLNAVPRVQSSPKEHVPTKMNLDSSDEDDLDVDPNMVRKKTKKKLKLQFSDDEGVESDAEFDQDQEYDEYVGDEEEQEAEGEVETENKHVDYDSEENEIELEEYTKKEQRHKTSDFFENEAELSESEWGSADEDEKDLDDLEFEQGDAEVFDNKKLKSDLERIHMRRVLDDDNREVKILQELLLDDGELHGVGRKRQFRWKNIDNPDNDGTDPKEEEDAGTYMDEEESEEQWRKMRHEREMFLKDQQRKSSQAVNDNEDDDDEDLTEKLCTEKKVHIEQTIVKNNLTNVQRTSVVATNNASGDAETDIKLPFTSVNKRGSFLARNDNVLTRLAEFTKVTTSVVGGAKNSRNFLFQSVEVKTTEMISLEKKRKGPSGTPQILKKLRLSENLSPAGAKRSTKTSNSKVKKLFA